MTHWIRFERSGTIRLDPRQGGVRIECGGDPFSRPSVTGRSWHANEARRPASCRCGKCVGVRDNGRANVARQGPAVPDELLYLSTRRTRRAVTAGALRAAARDDGKVVLEGKWAW
jgi:hypothetical protein